MRALVNCKSLARSPVIPVLAALVGLCASAAEAQTYKITNLGTLCQPNSTVSCFGSDVSNVGSIAFDVNNSGQVVGASHWEARFPDSQNDERYSFAHCFRTAANQVINPATDRLALYDPKENFRCFAYGINDDGVVVGAIGPLRNVDHIDLLFDSLAFHVRANGVMETLKDTLQCPSPFGDPGPYPFGCPYSAAFAINNPGTIVGTANTGEKFSEAPVHAFRLSQQLQDLGTLLPIGGVSEARGINDLNFIVGSSDGGPGGVVQRAVRFGGGSVHDLGSLGGSACTFCSGAAYDINNVATNPTVLGPKGQVVGWSTLSVSGPRHAFFRDLGVTLGHASDMIDLGDLCAGAEHGHCRSGAFAINDLGQIVGESQIVFGSQATHAFEYRVETGVMRDLNNALTFVDRVLWELTDAQGINDLGQIVGTGVYMGQKRAYRLDPWPPQLTKNLNDLLEGFNLADKGIEQSLRAKLRATQEALARDDRLAACGQTGAFDRDVRAQAGRGLTERQAATLLAGATLLRRDLECR